MSDRRASESRLSALLVGLGFSPFSVSEAEQITHVFALLRPTDQNARWYAATSGDRIESLALMWSTFLSLQNDRDQIEKAASQYQGQTLGRLIFAACHAPGRGVQIATRGLSDIEKLAVARLTRSYLMDDQSTEPEQVEVSEIVDLPMLLGPAESEDMPLEVEYALLVFAIEDGDGDFRWAYRTSGNINRLELIGALDLEIQKLHRTLTEFD